MAIKDNFTYDVVFQSDNSSNNKGFSSNLEYCKDYIRMYNGTDESYFRDYKGGTVQIVCNETSEVVYEEEVKATQPEPIRISELCFVYGKTDRMRTFKAFDLDNGLFQGNLIYASLLENSEENQRKLQQLADLNKRLHLQLQLREGNKVVFETKS